MPRWDEDPEFVSQLLEQFKGLDVQGTDPRPRYEKVRAETRACLPWHKRGSFDRKLDRHRNFLWQREEMRDRSMRVYYLIRRYALALAEERGLGDDIFFMTWREVVEDDRSGIERAREVYDSYRNFAPPNEIGSRFGRAEVAEGALVGIGAQIRIVEGTRRRAVQNRPVVVYGGLRHE